MTLSRLLCTPLFSRVSTVSNRPQAISATRTWEGPIVWRCHLSTAHPSTRYSSESFYFECGKFRTGSFWTRDGFGECAVFISQVSLCIGWARRNCPATIPNRCSTVRGIKRKTQLSSRTPCATPSSTTSCPGESPHICTATPAAWTCNTQGRCSCTCHPPETKTACINSTTPYKRSTPIHHATVRRSSSLATWNPAWPFSSSPEPTRSSTPKTIADYLSSKTSCISQSVSSKTHSANPRNTSTCPSLSCHAQTLSSSSTRILLLSISTGRKSQG